MAIRLQTIGFLAMIPAPVVTMVRALLVLAGITEPSWYWLLFAVGGSLSGIGIILVAISTYGGPRFRWVIAGAIIAIVGHYILPRTPAGLTGPSLVQLGTGIILWPWQRYAVAAGVVAGAGAYLRHWMPTWGNVLLLLGAGGLLTALLAAARPLHRDMQPPE